MLLKFMINICSILYLLVNIIFDFIIIVLSILSFKSSSLYTRQWKMITERRKKIIEIIMGIVLDDYTGYKMQKGRCICFGLMMLFSMLIPIEEISEWVKGGVITVLFILIFVVYIGAFEMLVDVIDKHADKCIVDNGSEAYYDGIAKKIEMAKDLLPVNIIFLNAGYLVVMSFANYSLSEMIHINDELFKFACAFYTFAMLILLVIPNYIFYSLSIHYYRVKSES